MSTGITSPAAAAPVPLRPPHEVMRLDRMGSFFPTRLSFMRSVIRTLASEAAAVQRVVWELDDQGFGHAVYSITMGGDTYSLVAFSNALPDHDRTDRVIAERWDTAYVLFDGIPSAADVMRLQSQAPLQESGRFTPRELVLSRANKSVRLFDHVATSLAAGHQPDEKMIRSIGYLMRTTAVYGNGKFGIADRQAVATRPGMSHPFRPELLTVWLIRNFTHDLVEHVAWRRSPESFVPLDRRLKRHLGIGNSTGLGMAPFLVNHPILINNWMLARETALARVRSLDHGDRATTLRLNELTRRARAHVDDWNVNDERQMGRIVLLRDELSELAGCLDDLLTEPRPFDNLVQWSRRRSLECQELIVSLVLEPFGDLIDELTCCMESPVEPRLDPKMYTTHIRDLIDAQWSWTLDIDYENHHQSAQFWYVSEDKAEPRLGLRYEEPGAEREQPLDIGRRVQALYRDLPRTRPEEQSSETVAMFLVDHPEHRYAVTRVQTLEVFPYGEIHDNLISLNCAPIDMLRSKLSFFGASKFDPRSDRWTRITMYQGAPLADELDAADPDDWWLPVLV